MFKVDWEKTSITYQLPEGMVEAMVRLAYPDKKLTSSELIAGGCANLNFKIQLENEKHPLILRVYLRDKDAAYREQKLATLLKETAPVPLTHYIGKLEGHHFAITEFISGISLRDFLLSNAPDAIGALMSEVGVILSKIIAHECSEAGLLNKELELIAYESSNVIKFAHDCLNYKRVLSVLSPQVVGEIKEVIEQQAYLFPNNDEKHLVHDVLENLISHLKKNISRTIAAILAPTVKQNMSSISLVYQGSVSRLIVMKGYMKSISKPFIFLRK
jgi:hypothetical protein